MSEGFTRYEMLFSEMIEKWFGVTTPPDAFQLYTLLQESHPEIPGVHMQFLLAWCRFHETKENCLNDDMIALFFRAYLDPEIDKKIVEDLKRRELETVSQVQEFLAERLNVSASSIELLPYIQLAYRSFGPPLIHSALTDANKDANRFNALLSQS